MMQIVILGVAFFCVALLVVSAYAWLDRRRLAAEQLTRSRLLGDSRAQAQEISISATTGRATSASWTGCSAARASPAG